MIAKQKRLLIICGIVFAVLLVAYIAFIRPLTAPEEGEEEIELPETLEGEDVSELGRFYMFPHVQRAGMQSIKVENEYGSYEFYRDKNGDFQIRGFEGAAYNLERFSELVTSAGHTLAKVKVVDNATDAELEEYGLHDPQANWVVTTTTGEIYKVYVGYDLLTGGGYYCMLEGRRSVYVLDEGLTKTILAPIENLCSPALIAGIQQDDYYVVDNFIMMHGEEILCAIGITDPADHQNAQSLQENYMIHPSGYFPNTDMYYKLLYDIATLTGRYVVKLGPTDGDLAEYGLENPAHTVSFAYGGMDFMLLFSERQADGSYYAMSNLFPQVVSIAGETVEFLEYDLLDWVQAYPFQQWLTSVESTEVVGSGADVKFTLHHGTDAEGNATLAVTTNTGKTIPAEEVYNYRQFFKTLLSVAIQGYAPLTEEEIDALATDENCILTFTIVQTNGKTTVYRFYPYSSTGRRALMTVNGFGEFYVQTDLVEKIASDANKVLSGLIVDSYGKD